MTITTYPLSSLRLSPLNVRKAKPSAIDALAADILAHGLLQNLIGYEEDDKIMICAGGRRYRALKVLHKAKDIAPSFEVAVDLRSVEEAHELSLAENVQREPMQPADAILAFKALIDGGMEVEDVAARFGVSIGHVRRLLRLAGLHPKLIAAMRNDDLSVASAQSLAIGDDQSRQLEAFKQCGDNPSRLRVFLTEAKISCSSALFQLVGEEAYLEAGGSVTCDLFSEDDEQFADDLRLLHNLAEARLATLADEALAEGWGNVIANIERPENFYALHRLYPDSERELTSDEEQDHASLDEIITALKDDGVDYFDERIRDAKVRKREIEERLRFHSDEQKAEATLYLFVGYQELERIAVGKPKNARSKASGEGCKSDYPAKLLSDLGAIRTLAVREALAKDSALALDILLDTMIGQLLGTAYSFEQALDLRMEDKEVEAKPELVDGCQIYSVEDVAGDLLGKLQGDDKFDVIAALDLTDKLRLLAFCTASQITSDALGSAKGEAIDKFGRKAGLDMTTKWQPSAAFYMRLSKPTMLKLLTEHCGSDAAAYCAKLKKAELAEACADRLKDCGYMPPCFVSGGERSEGEIGLQEAA